MARPDGLLRKTKDNTKKNHRSREEWNAGKRIGRPKQVFNPETKTWSKA